MPTPEIDLTQGPVTFYVTPIPGPKGDPGQTGPAGMGASVPGGRLSLVSGQPEMLQNADYTSTVLHYPPFESDQVPLFDGTDWAGYPFTSGPLDTAGLSMAGGSKWTAGSKRDVFITLSEGCAVLGTGPAWPADSVASRGLVRRNGLWVNSAALSLDVSASAALSVPEHQATWVGSINIGTAGVLEARFTLGQNRRCDVWNVYHQREILLGVGCPPPTPTGAGITYAPNSTHQYPNFKAFNGDLNNSGYYFTGLPQNVEREYKQNAFLNTYGHGAGALMVAVSTDTIGNFSALGAFSSDQQSAATGYFQGSVCAVSKSIHRSIGEHRAIMAVAGANNFTGVTLYGMDGRSMYGPLDRCHVLWIKYQG